VSWATVEQAAVSPGAEFAHLRQWHALELKSIQVRWRSAAAANSCAIDLTREGSAAVPSGPTTCRPENSPVGCHTHKVRAVVLGSMTATSLRCASRA
jgi:hypothetical protein